MPATGMPTAWAPLILFLLYILVRMASGYVYDVTFDANGEERVRSPFHSDFQSSIDEVGILNCFSNFGKFARFWSLRIKI
jgi:hypothetical protein